MMSSDQLEVDLKDGLTRSEVTLGVGRQPAQSPFRCAKRYVQPVSVLTAYYSGSQTFSLMHILSPYVRISFSVSKIA